MKRTILLFALISFTVFRQYGQTSLYHPMPTSNAVWNIDYYLAPCWPIFSYSETYSIVMSGDTTINSKIYHKLYTPAVIKSNPTTSCGGQSPGYKGAIREDTLLKKVFIAWDTTEILLYDFNMQVGDTVKGLTEISSCPDTVISIDSVLVGSNYHKRWFINADYNIYFIEGVGSTYGLLGQSIGQCIGQFPDLWISCFSKDGVTLYPSLSTNCEIITSTHSINSTLNEVNIYPNPSTGSFTIDLNDTGINEIQLYDVFGNLIFRQFKSDNSKIKIDDLKAGVYFLTLIDSFHNKSTRKIISSK
jgi:hypothetical protein